MPWDPAIDFRYVKKVGRMFAMRLGFSLSDDAVNCRLMSASTNSFMEIWRSMKPVVAKIKRVAIGGGSDMSLACDATFIEDTAQFGYPPVRILVRKSIQSKEFSSVKFF